ncbi:MAG: hypothetical protein M1821_004343 [Bathelium mastoideum]|nr:MAG: hypothetical protein M1821_004343 [Bathelium mastoideum]
MPLYDVEYVTPLTDQAQEELAKALTRIHADRFGTPSYFVNVRYVDVSSQKVFRGGIARRYNRIIFRCRAGETRSVALYNEHCASIVEAWGRIIGREPEKELRAVWVQACLTTALEANFFRPQVGEEKSWLRQHAHEFQELAEAGDEDMKGLRDELRMRADFADVLNHQQGKRG